ncbi:hypothetical protein KI387_008767, partial [Taxus chinensis]
VSPTKYRGSLGTTSQLGTCIGMIVALVLGIPCETDSHWWRAMFFIASVTGFLLIIGLQFVAESPRWLGKVGRWEEAKTVISQLWGKSQIECALKELKDANNLDRSCEEANWSELLTKRHYKAPAIGGTLFVLQQFAGINGVLYFSSLTFSDMGISDNMAASISVGIANFAGAIIALYLMDKQGRRSLLLGSYMGMASSMFLLVVPFSVPVNEQMSHFLSIFGTLMYVFTFSIGAGPVTGLIITELSSTRTRAKTMAFSLCVHWVCNFVIGLFFIDLMERFGLPIVYSSFGIVSLLAAAFTYYNIIETKGRSLEEIEYLLNPSLERSDRERGERGRRIQRSPSPPNRTLSTPPLGRPFIQSTRVLRPIRMAQPNPYVNFTGSNPLALNAQNPVPIAALKNIPYFTRENQTTPGDHVKDIANVCAIHEIVEMKITVKLLASSFKGKSLQWFRSLEVGSIQNWNQLCTALHNQFGEKGDNLSLLEQLTTIKRAPNEQLTDFNFRFQRIWDRIPLAVRPTAQGAFLYFLKALNSDISMLIQSMGGVTIPAAYNITIRAENCLIQAGKLAPMPPMPLYPELESPSTSQAPTLAPIPTPRN